MLSWLGSLFLSFFSLAASASYSFVKARFSFQALNFCPILESGYLLPIMLREIQMPAIIRASNKMIISTIMPPPRPPPLVSSVTYSSVVPPISSASVFSPLPAISLSEFSSCRSGGMYVSGSSSSLPSLPVPSV